MNASTLAALSTDPNGEHEPPAQVVPDTLGRRLCRAVLARAIMDALGRHSLAGEKLRRARASVVADARAWIASDVTRPWGFVWTCAMLGLDPKRIRRSLSFMQTGTAAKPDVVVAIERERGAA